MSSALHCIPPLESDGDDRIGEVTEKADAGQSVEAYESPSSPLTSDISFSPFQVCVTNN